jgi:hypothetical protein
MKVSLSFCPALTTSTFLYLEIALWMTFSDRFPSAIQDGAASLHERYHKQEHSREIRTHLITQKAFPSRVDSPVEDLLCPA